MDADKTFKLLAEAYQQVTEKADSYGDDGQKLQAINILPSVLKPGKRGKLEEIALKEPTDGPGYVILYRFGTVVKNRDIQVLLHKLGIDAMLQQIPTDTYSFDQGVKICSKVALKIITDLTQQYSNAPFTMHTDNNDGFMIYMKDNLLVHIFVQELVD